MFPTQEARTIKFHYRNHRSEVAERTVSVQSIQYLRNPGFGYAPGWFICGYCHTKGANRSFAFANIIVSEGALIVRLLQL